MRRRPNGGEAPPRELEDWYLWCINSGAFDTTAHSYDESKRPEWVRQRRAWAAEHGWPGGEAAMLAGEVIVEEEPWDPEAI
jgi:hypothetical protein